MRTFHRTLCRSARRLFPAAGRASRIGALGVTLALSFLVGTGMSQEATDQGTYRIGPGDTLEIVVWRSDEVSRGVTVRPDGFISLPLLNDVRAAGRTPMELREELVRKYERVISSPMVTVIVADVSSFDVSVLGRVRRAGRYEFRGPTTVLDVLAMAGGPDDYADMDRILILRPGKDTFERIRFNYSEAVRGNGNGGVSSVQGGDIIIVP